MIIQWFPGHMAKTRKLITENLKLVDTVIVLLDARIPISSKNPELESIIGNKSTIIVMNKSDIADSNISKLWKDYYERINKTCIFIDSVKGTGFNEVKNVLKAINKPLLEKGLSKGRIFRPIRTMVVGIPNVGKSSFINKIAGRAIAVTGDRPGVTKNKQWIRLNEEIELLDTPGILWPKFDDEEVALNLAYTGAIKDDILDIVELSSKLVSKLSVLYPKYLESRYKLNLSKPDVQGIELLAQCGKNRGCLLKGGEIDYYRIASIVLDEFRGAKIGKITLETPNDLLYKEQSKDENNE